MFIKIGRLWFCSKLIRHDRNVLTKKLSKKSVLLAVEKLDTLIGKSFNSDEISVSKSINLLFPFVYDEPSTWSIVFSCAIATHRLRSPDFTLIVTYFLALTLLVISAVESKKCKALLLHTAICREMLLGTWNISCKLRSVDELSDTIYSNASKDAFDFIINFPYDNKLTIGEYLLTNTKSSPVTLENVVQTTSGESQRKASHLSYCQNHAGSALILYNTFDGEQEQLPREGAENECRMIEQACFKKDITVTVEKDIAGAKMIPALTRFLENLSDVRSREPIYLFMMSHGRLGHIAGNDGQHIRIQDIISAFNRSELVATPKLLFLQCCQSDEGGIGNDPLPSRSNIRRERFFIDQKEMMMTVSVIPGGVARRMIFMLTIAQEMSKYGELDIQTMMDYTAQTLLEKFDQVPITQKTLSSPIQLGSSTNKCTICRHNQLP